MAKLGLVLSGGGAKGAYHVGVIKALQELGIQFDMLSGASIGALNSAVLLSAENQQQGLKHLEQLWDKLPSIKPIQFKDIGAGTYISLLMASGLKLATPKGFGASLVNYGVEKLNIPLEGFCKQEPLSEMMAEFLNLEHLNRAVPFYISTYKIKDNEKALERFKETLIAAKDFLKAEVLGLDNQYSEFYKIQDLSIEEQKNYILASAALPLIFLPQKDDKGNRFVDGGLGGAVKSQGNTPITPLIEAGCTHIIVSHLDQGSLWHRHDFSNTTVLEIRPHQSLDMSFARLLDFSQENIERLRMQGYLDAKHELSRVMQALNIFKIMQEDRQTLSKSVAVLENSETQLDEVMKRL